MVDIHVGADGLKRRRCRQARHRAARDDRQEHRRRRACLFADAGRRPVWSRRASWSAPAPTRRSCASTRRCAPTWTAFPVGIPEPLIVGRGIDDVAIVVAHAVADSRRRRRAGRERPDPAGARTPGRGGEAARHRPHLHRRRAARGDPGRARPGAARRSTASRCSSSSAKIAGANRSFQAGTVRDDGEQRTVVAGQTLQAIAEIGNLLLTARDGRPVYVRDVADGSCWRPSPTRTASPTSGRRTTGLTARAGGLAGDRQAAGHQRRRHRRGDRASASNRSRGQIFPEDVEMTVTRNYGETANEKANELLFHLGLATISIVVLVADRHRLARGDRRRGRHPDHDPADALRRAPDGLHAEPRQPVRADLLDRHPGRRRHRGDREHRPPLGDAGRAARARRRRSTPSPRSATRPSSRR